MGLFSFFKHSAQAILVYHDDAVKVLQFEKAKNGFKVTGFNELSLTEGLVKDANIVNLEVFEEVLQNLFDQAKPHPIKVDKLYVNIPYQNLYTYVKDFAYRLSQTSVKDAMMETAKSHFPFEMDDMILDFLSREHGHTISAAIYATTQRWRGRVEKACQHLGAGKVEFIPEPLCHLALRGEPLTGDAALFSCHQNKVYITLFRNGLIYDSYFLLSLEDTETAQCFNCQHEFSKAQADFQERFNASLNELYFVGFPEDYQKRIKEHFDSTDQSVIIIDSEKARLSSFMPFDNSKITLFGMFNHIMAE